MKLCKFPKKSKEEIYKIQAEKQNKAKSKKFAAVPFDKRIVFVPHCMRKTSVCTAVEKDSYYICGRCGACKINNIVEIAKRLGYKDIFILKGGRAIEKIIAAQKPLAIAGVACYFEGAQAFQMLNGKPVSVQFAPLTKDGCADTDTDLNVVERVLSQRAIK
ncbi:DUF116 domain-containing protein [Endomicrobium proavitum]|uniref:DUF116 domain-containing protein n=1 Tax=Endomicrobium proavitum TaxID=1408281 RepID=A0A0G3WKW4_9BACT|nr:DUF116 domain-containing protein [Endomicrobium proavitum]AKL98515.1 hypothetical protein Epro_1136 [Endomicrobium proavitum]